LCAAKLKINGNKIKGAAGANKWFDDKKMRGAEGMLGLPNLLNAQ